MASSLSPTPAALPAHVSHNRGQDVAMIVQPLLIFDCPTSKKRLLLVQQQGDVDESGVNLRLLPQVSIPPYQPLSAFQTVLPRFYPSDLVSPFQQKLLGFAGIAEVYLHSSCRYAKPTLECLFYGVISLQSDFPASAFPPAALLRPGYSFIPIEEFCRIPHCADLLPEAIMDRLWGPEAAIPSPPAPPAASSSSSASVYPPLMQIHESGFFRAKSTHILEEVTFVVCLRTVRNAAGQDEEQILLVEERDGTLFLPAGHVDHYETYLQGGAREALEEAGIVIDTKGVIDCIYGYGSKLHGFSHFHMIVQGEAVGGKLKTVRDKESNGAHWMPVATVLAELARTTGRDDWQKYRNYHEMLYIIPRAIHRIHAGEVVPLINVS